MDRKTYRRCRALIGASLALLAGFFVNTGNYVGLIVALTVALTVHYLCKRRVTEIIQDERYEKIEERAAKISLWFGILGMAIGGPLLVTLSNAGYFELRGFGRALSGAGLILLIIYLLLFWFYRKYPR